MPQGYLWCQPSANSALVRRYYETDDRCGLCLCAICSGHMTGRIFVALLETVVACGAPCCLVWLSVLPLILKTCIQVSAMERKQKQCRGRWLFRLGSFLSGRRARSR